MLLLELEIGETFYYHMLTDGKECLEFTSKVQLFGLDSVNNLRFQSFILNKRLLKSHAASKNKIKVVKITRLTASKAGDLFYGNAYAGKIKVLGKPRTLPYNT